MRKEWQPLLWFSFRDALGWRWRVYFVSYDIAPEDFEQCSGMALMSDRKIYIHAGDPIPRQNATLVHELTHVAVNNGCGSAPSRYEEDTVESSCGPLAHILPQLGLKIPPRPIGYDALARHAKRIHKSLCST